MIKVSDYVIKRLEETGAEHMFMLPGGGVMHLNDSLGHNEELKVSIIIMSRLVPLCRKIIAVCARLLALMALIL